MLERNMMQQPAQPTPQTETPPGQGMEPGGGGGDMSTQQLIDHIMKLRGGDETGMSAEEEFRVRQETRNFVMDTQAIFKDELPDATRGQMQQFSEGMVNMDPAIIIRAVLDAQRVGDEQEMNTMRGETGDLHVQGGGAGRGQSARKAPRSVQEASLMASQLFR